MLRTTVCLFALIIAPLASGAEPLSENEEIAIALEAAPGHLRGGAGVYVLRADGFVRARAARNGFNCLINRELPESFEPECFDAEGSETLLPVILLQAQLRARRLAAADIEREVAAGFASGRFRAPRRTGICYMLSTRNVVVMDRKAGRVGAVGPHLMFYSPYLSNADFGATPDLASHFVVAEEGTPVAMIIVPVASTDAHRH